MTELDTRRMAESLYLETLTEGSSYCKKIIKESLDLAYNKGVEDMRYRASRCADDHCGGERIGEAIRKLEV